MVGQSKLFAVPGEDVRLPVAHMVRLMDASNVGAGASTQASPAMHIFSPHTDA